MKVYLNKPSEHWISPYTICERLCWWREIDYHEPWVQRLHNFLLPLCMAWSTLANLLHPRIQYVKIDPWDTWSMDSTLTPIILPMLKQLRNGKMGSPHVDDEDVPELLRRSNAAPTANEWDTDEFWHLRWEWVMNQMIWSFEQLNSDWESQFHTGTHDIYWEKTGEFHKNPITGEMEEVSEMKRGPNDTSHFDFEGYQLHSERIDLGLRLFGKYYRNLWD